MLGFTESLPANSEHLLELLLSAEQSFYDLPSPSPPVRGSHLLHVIYLRPLPPAEPVAGEEGGGDPEIATPTASPVKMSTLRRTYSIGLQDSILTLEARIKVRNIRVTLILCLLFVMYREHFTSAGRYLRRESGRCRGRCRRGCRCRRRRSSAISTCRELHRADAKSS